MRSTYSDSHSLYNFNSRHLEAVPLLYNEANSIINGLSENFNPQSHSTGLQKYPQTTEMVQVKINHYFLHFTLWAPKLTFS